MNYIKKLEAENARRQAEIDARDAAIAELRDYLLSSKFSVDPTVQTRDVLTRLEQGLHWARVERGI